MAPPGRRAGREKEPAGPTVDEKKDIWYNTKTDNAAGIGTERHARGGRTGFGEYGDSKAGARGSFRQGAEDKRGEPAMKRTIGARALLSLLMAFALLTGGAVPALAQEQTQPADVAEVSPDWENWTQEDWDAWYQQLHRQEKEEMGCPYPDGVNVNLNGQFLTFETARPVIVEGRTMLPLRDTLEAMGAEVVWDVMTRTASATFESGAVIRSTMDSSTLVVEKDGDTTTVEMDVAPLVQEGHILIPVRFFAQAVGYDVSWDDYYQIVWLEDAAATVREIDERFENYNHLLSLALQQQTESGKTYSIGMDGTLEAVLYGDEENYTASAKSRLEGLVRDKSLSLDADVYVTPDFVGEFIKASAVDQQTKDRVDEVFALLEHVFISVIVNEDEGTGYIKTNLFELVDDGWDDSAWVKVQDLPSLPDMQELMALLMTGLPQTGEPDITVGKVIYAVSNTGYGSTGERARELADLLELFYGDKYLKKSQAGDTITYQVSHTKSTLALFGGLLQGELGAGDGAWDKVEKLNFDMTLRERDGKVLDSTLSFDTRVGGAFPFEITVTAQSDDAAGEMRMELRGDYVGKLTMEMDVARSESRQQVPAGPAFGDKVVSLEELMQGQG